MVSKGNMKSKNWCLVPMDLHVTKARNSKEGIVPHLFKDKTGKVVLFSGTDGIVSEKKAISFLKEKKLEKKLKQIPMYPDDVKKIKK